MRTTTSKTSRDPYLELVLKFPLRPIRSRSAHREAKSVLRSLVGKRGSAARDYKSVLVALITDYERAAHLQMDTSKVSASDIVMHLLGERAMTVNALAKALDVAQSSLSDMLNGRREWSKSVIIGVSDYFGLEPGLFLR